MALAGYHHLLRAADRLRWDDATLDVGSDRAAWRVLPAHTQERVARLIAGFCVAETAVAVHLEPFVAAAEDPQLEACFRAQADDEARHARFFTRVAAEVCGIEDARERAAPALLELFERELPARAAAVASGGPLAQAVALYHLILEGVVFLTGQRALIEELEAVGSMPVVLDGAKRVQADERWHIGLGVHALRSLGARDIEEGYLNDTLRLACRCWDVDFDWALARHARRLEIVVDESLGGG